MREAEEELRRSEQRFRALLHHASEHMLVWDLNGVITYASPATVRFAAGAEPDEYTPDIEYTNVFMHPDDLPKVREIVVGLASRPGATEHFVARYRRHDGVYRSLDVTVTNLLADPAVQGFVANSRDVTERLEFEEQLQAREERFRALVQHSSDIIAVVDATADVLYASAATGSILGYRSGDALIGTNALTLVHPDDLDLGRALLNGLLAEPMVTRRRELRIRHADGTWRSMSVAASNHLTDPTVQGIVLNGRDVTERRIAEDAQRASEAWYRSLVQHGNDMIVVLDRQANVRYFSPSIEYLHGPGTSAAGQLADRVHPNDRSAVAARFARAFETPGSQPPIEMRALHSDGSWRWLEMIYTNQFDDPTVAGLIINLRDITERKEAEAQLAHQALHDALTGLPNRVLLVDRLDHALARAARNETNVGVVFLDLDRFKLVNDTRGHGAGDSLLASVAVRLQEVARTTDTVARFGGDEFVFVREDVGETDELVEVARQLCSELAMQFDVDGSEVRCTASAGVAISHGSTDAGALLRDADAAMYDAKESARGGVSAFDDSIRIRAENRFETERALRTALERDELTLVYQPIVTLDTGEIVGAEALLRWQHPERGIVGPDEFIDLAEETGLIVPIGAAVLEWATRQLAAWSTGAATPTLGIAVNVSAAQLRHPDLPSLVAASLEAAGLAPERLTLEITESSLVEDTLACAERLAALKAIGVQIVLDDFGVRHSSLGYLNRMPVDGLKIDRVFVHRIGREPRDTAIISAILAMADTLDLSVIAEGIETSLQHRVLAELGCQFAQGFRYSKPQKAEELLPLLAAGRITEPGS